MTKDAGLGRIGKNYPRNGAAPGDALARFDRDLTEPEARSVRNELTLAVLVLLVVLGVVGWAFTL